MNDARAEYLRGAGFDEGPYCTACRRPVNAGCADCRRPGCPRRDRTAGDVHESLVPPAVRLPETHGVADAGTGRSPAEPPQHELPESAGAYYRGAGSAVHPTARQLFDQRWDALLALGDELLGGTPPQPDVVAAPAPDRRAAGVVRGSAVTADQQVAQVVDALHGGNSMPHSRAIIAEFVENVLRKFTIPSAEEAEDTALLDAIEARGRPGVGWFARWRGTEVVLFQSQHQLFPDDAKATLRQALQRLTTEPA